ncbi:MBL fold metallo-hydrolase [Peptacetobacter sp.]|uniref:MBL fold metallo-hydrolase n=1 Tax=Peptacetobacter sp. TaxID=2991975 RepID=UPI00262A1595|nr:MBL fold metallo-hydrolase [Peptacetobacter sp.]
MKITMLGTGNAMVTKCYNTTFVITDKDKYFLVDGGGGNQIFNQLEKSNIDWKNIKEIFVTHKHIDHLIGVIWMIRKICRSMKKGEYIGDVNIYAHEELSEIINSISYMLLNKKETDFIGQRVHIVSVKDGEEREIIGNKTVFFDIHSTKAKQFGFSMYYDEDKKLTCCGDEPYNEVEEKYAKNSNWLLHEAFCLYSDREKFKPYEKNHSTVKDACKLAEELNIDNLILYHTEDKNIKNRKNLYLNEGQKYFKGNIFIPDDLESIEL